MLRPVRIPLEWVLCPTPATSKGLLIVSNPFVFNPEVVGSLPFQSGQASPTPATLNHLKRWFFIVVIGIEPITSRSTPEGGWGYEPYGNFHKRNNFLNLPKLFKHVCQPANDF